MNDATRGAFDDEVVFRTLAAPGLEEDDLFAAMSGLPGGGALWGEGVPNIAVPTELEWDEEFERRQRHEALLRRWSPISDSDGAGPQTAFRKAHAPH